MYRCPSTLRTEGKRQLYKNELPTLAAVPMVVRPGRRPSIESALDQCIFMAKFIHYTTRVGINSP